jgi:hypothetical protein
VALTISESALWTCESDPEILERIETEAFRTAEGIFRVPEK